MKCASHNLQSRAAEYIFPFFLEALLGLLVEIKLTITLNEREIMHVKIVLYVNFSVKHKLCILKNVLLEVILRYLKY